MSELIIDLTNKDEVLKSLSKFVGVGERDIVLFLCTKCGRYVSKNTYEDFIEYYGINVKEIDLNDIYLKSIHVTTGRDKGQSIIKNGIYNLQDALRKETNLKKFLNKYEIFVDVDKKLIKYRDTEIKLEYKLKKIIGEERNWVHYKIYDDYMVNGFHWNDNPLKYGGQVAYRPEILHNIGELLGCNNLGLDWYRANNECYIVEFKAKAREHLWFNFQIDNLSEEEFNSDKDKYIIKWIIQQSLHLIKEQLSGSKGYEINSYLERGYNVPSSDIIRVTDVTELRNNM